MYHSNYGMARDEFFTEIGRVSTLWFGLNIVKRETICKAVGWPVSKSKKLALHCEDVTVPQLFIIGKRLGIFPEGMGCPIL